MNGLPENVYLFREVLFSSLVNFDFPVEIDKKCDEVRQKATEDGFRLRVILTEKDISVPAMFASKCDVRISPRPLEIADEVVVRTPKKDYYLKRRGTPPSSPLSGRWHHGNGALACGTLRVARADFDTNPSETVQAEVFDWICEVLNNAQC
jgi:hypothetical protein